MSTQMKFQLNINSEDPDVVDPNGDGLIEVQVWTCDICGQQYPKENDLLAHQFNSNCDPSHLNQP